MHLTLFYVGTARFKPFWTICRVVPQKLPFSESRSCDYYAMFWTPWLQLASVRSNLNPASRSSRGAIYRLQAFQNRSPFCHTMPTAKVISLSVWPSESVQFGTNWPISFPSSWLSTLGINIAIAYTLANVSVAVQPWFWDVLVDAFTPDAFWAVHNLDFGKEPCSQLGIPWQLNLKSILRTYVGL